MGMCVYPGRVESGLDLDGDPSQGVPWGVSWPMVATDGAGSIPARADATVCATAPLRRRSPSPVVRRTG
ncbi:hypothetical protein JCM10369A_42730 [Nocardioides pyridinolyticus]